ncbi:MAG TPA: glycosyltransferase [Opitutaceae bacterium]|nr:glycosyltransferase [Opitutaceae bacterium]
MPEARPAFSIVMPTRNHARWIEQAIRSVLDQEFDGKIELIVLDALSDDGTTEILQRYQDRIVWRRAADRGQFDAINQGFALARGEIVAWLNSDDVYLPGAFARVHAAFAADPALDFVYGDVLEIGADGRILTPNPFTEDCVAERYFLSHNYICQPTVFMRRHVPVRVGPLRKDLRWFLDYEWFTRFFKHGLRGLRLKHFLAANRDHPATITNSGGLARWREAMRVLARNPGPFFLARRCVWIYSLEYVIKSFNAAGWAAPPERPSAERNWRQRFVDRLNAWLMRLVRPRSFDDIICRYGTDIAPQGANVADLWRRAATATAAHGADEAPLFIPLAPNLTTAYPRVVAQMHDAMRLLLFPQLPLVAGRTELLAKLIGTSIPEAMYVLAELHAALGVPGDVCEFGVAQGATSALLANEIRATDKRLWLYDSFAGLPKPSAKDELKDDIFQLGSIERYEGEMRCDADEVKFRLAQIGFPAERTLVNAGWVQDTLREGAGPQQVCFAYVDFDFYEPIAYALDYLDRHLSPGGRMVVDDYDFFSTGAKTAVDEFVAAQSGRYELVRPAEFAGAFCVLRKKADATGAVMLASSAQRE